MCRLSNSSHELNLFKSLLSPVCLHFIHDSTACFRERKEKETEEDWSSDTPCEVGDQMGDRQVQAAAVFRSYGLYLVMGYT